MRLGWSFALPSGLLSSEDWIGRGDVTASTRPTTGCWASRTQPSLRHFGITGTVNDDAAQ